MFQNNDSSSAGDVACYRLRDSGGKSFSNKKCEKRAGAEERQFSRRHRPLSQVVRVLISLLIRSHYVYYLRAWHRLPPPLAENCPYADDLDIIILDK